ncbi:hypothetical protein TorRG33x02_140550 [Trema orientale]|uniref:Uncharacterized protein n=1 Tax=Trema orientale TaxID=63057 RepID=A0A2P5EXE5_TREOI|nr:hypothetical protein TorRG33x02_140550 [Trema orientale]
MLAVRARQHRTVKISPKNQTAGSNFRGSDLSHQSSVSGVASRDLTISEYSSARGGISFQLQWPVAAASFGRSRCFWYFRGRLL